jgi:hypothetical protein
MVIKHTCHFFMFMLVVPPMVAVQSVLFPNLDFTHAVSKPMDCLSLQTVPKAMDDFIVNNENVESIHPME